MASFVKDAQIKAFKIPSGKKRVLLNDEASKNLEFLRINLEFLRDCFASLAMTEFRNDEF